MKAADLMLNNLVKKDKTEILISTYDLINIDLNLNEYEPIPLTEEWLLKLGFIDKELKLTQNTSLYVCIRTKNKFQNEGKALIMQMGNAILSMPCEYLHELQNIWKALTGEELTIKN